ncbi:MAG: serine--tRNA ligase [Candidatus Margulisiibacteriota bacterium]|nr:MAG: serine--tRNA ligase [Candidatus Margulisbacteria bacterium GWD2_39_127]OGI08815.1 MAG: serine--tRNA ligase [Candidatus Margulisbacteria bacterium GWE2_39_32]PZM78646.1 MAG: serine--tRNA ligase [Candidatus Margulisiibacteriota bacterium]HAR61988.1 serine--tRNA ligase [Candidatus Margulisiibacteriota bacterium]HCT85018.1 serine--tRNA ligase [Candidatus Margulisiibacteriota bacterium]
MLNPKLIRMNPELVEEALKKRNMGTELLEEFLAVDRQWRDLDTIIAAKKFERKQFSPKGKPSEEQLLILKKLSDEIKEEEDLVKVLEQKVESIALLFPNIPDNSVPVGTDAASNVVIKQWGEIREFDFQPSPHDELGQKLGILDFERGIKLAQSRFTVYLGDGAKLERALINFMLDTHTARSYKEVLPPFLVNSSSMQGTGQLPKFADDLFRCKDDDLWLIPTAEVPVTNLHRDEIIPEESLPLYYAAYTPCFRREAGSYGRDTKGIIRQHQFNKVELVKFVLPENSSDEHEKLTSDAALILELLGLPYRVISLCTGDLGFSSAKTYDLEVWFPSQNIYKEISSCSNFLDFQARRALIRYRSNKTEKAELLHTLNGSGLAVGRTFAAILENYQQKDGTVIIPEVLRPYMGGKKLLGNI